MPAVSTSTSSTAHPATMALSGMENGGNTKSTATGDRGEGMTTGEIPTTSEAPVTVSQRAVTIGGAVGAVLVVVLLLVIITVVLLLTVARRRRGNGGLENPLYDKG